MIRTLLLISQAACCDTLVRPTLRAHAPAAGQLAFWSFCSNVAGTHRRTKLVRVILVRVVVFLELIACLSPRRGRKASSPFPSAVHRPTRRELERVREVNGSPPPSSRSTINHTTRLFLLLLVPADFRSFPSLFPFPLVSVKMSKSIFAELPLFIPKEQLPSLPILALLAFIGLPVLAIALNVASQLVSCVPRGCSARRASGLPPEWKSHVEPVC